MKELPEADLAARYRAAKTAVDPDLAALAGAAADAAPEWRDAVRTASRERRLLLAEARDLPDDLLRRTPAAGGWSFSAAARFRARRLTYPSPTLGNGMVQTGSKSPTPVRPRG